MYSKKDIISLIKHWSKRTGRRFTEAVAVMKTRNFDITASVFKANFREHADRVTEYDPYEIMTLIYAFHDGLPSSVASRAFEAFLLCEWAGVLRMEKALVDLFGQREVEFAKERYEQIVEGNNYSFEDYLALLPEILGRPLVLSPGYTLHILNDSDMARQTETAKQSIWAGEPLQAERILDRLQKEALETENRGHKVPELVDIHHYLGILYTDQAKYDKASEHLLVARDRADKMGLTQTSSAILGNLGANDFYRGKYKDAKKYYLESHDKAVEAGIYPVIVFAKTALATIDLEFMNYAPALAGFINAYNLALQENMGDRVAYATLNLSYIHMLLGHHERAEHYLKIGFEFVKAIKHPELLAQFYCQSARLKIEQRDAYACDSELKTAFNIAQETGNQWLLQMIQLENAKSHLRQYRNEVALEIFEDLLKVALRYRNLELAFRSLYGISLAILSEQSSDGTLSYRYDFKQVLSELGQDLGKVRSLQLENLSLNNTIFQQTILYFKQGLDSYSNRLKLEVTNQLGRLLGLGQ